jgi:hypothetical protein
MQNGRMHVFSGLTNLLDYNKNCTLLAFWIYFSTLQFEDIFIEWAAIRSIVFWNINNLNSKYQFLYYSHDKSIKKIYIIWGEKSEASSLLRLRIVSGL